jgi:hypothetical protein
MQTAQALAQDFHFGCVGRGIDYHRHAVNVTDLIAQCNEKNSERHHGTGVPKDGESDGLLEALLTRHHGHPVDASRALGRHDGTVSQWVRRGIPYKYRRSVAR